jgi:hypothetical protein
MDVSLDPEHGSAGRKFGESKLLKLNVSDFFVTNLKSNMHVTQKIEVFNSPAN